MICRMGLSKFGFMALAVMVVGSPALASSAFAQDAQQGQPSVADAARAAAAAKKDKAAASTASKTVITEDSIGSGAITSSKAGNGTTSTAAADPIDKFKSLDEAWDRLQVTESALDQLDPLSKPELVNLVLQGNSSDFPNRGQWEDRLFVAKANYVQRSRQLVAATQQLLADIADLQKQGQLQASNPRVQALAKKSKQLTQLATRTESDFQSVVNEGKNALWQASK